MPRWRLVAGAGVLLLVATTSFAGSSEQDAEESATDADPGAVPPTPLGPVRQPPPRSPSTPASTTPPAREITTTTTPTTTAPPVTTAAPAASTTAAPAPSSPAPPAPAFHATIRSVTADELGDSWTPDRGCTSPEQLRMLEVSHWGSDGQVHVGRIVVAASRADQVVAAFRDLYAARFPIHQVVPIAEFDGDDQASMRANNTTGYNCRTVADTPTLSQHAYGLAIDVNPLVNPYVRGGRVDPPEGARWADRSLDDPGMIHAGDEVVQAFARQGWSWGGYWRSGKDYQHFSTTGR